MIKSYAINRRFFESKEVYTTQRFARNPSSTLYLGEGRLIVPTFFLDYLNAYPDDRIGFIHSKRSNMLMLDFHVESRSRQQTPTTVEEVDYGPQKNKRFWLHQE